VADSASGSGRARIEFENYRFRGKFRFELSGENLRVDFAHSSLLGAVQAEGSLFLSPDGMIMFDREKSKLYEDEECRRLAAEAAGASVTPDDIMLALQLSYPPYRDAGEAGAELSGNAWRIKGVWGERRLEFYGQSGRELNMMKISRLDRAWSFTVRYRYGAFGRDYPERIEIIKEDRSVRITLEVERFSES